MELTARDSIGSLEEPLQATGQMEVGLIQALEVLARKKVLAFFQGAELPHLEALVYESSLMFSHL